MAGRANGCSAELHSAVSRICNPLPGAAFGQPADCKSAIRQVKNLRYEGAVTLSPVKAY